MNDALFLKIKLRNLADEARLIRREEKRPRNAPWRERLYLHRILVVRREARATAIAYAYLRGRRYAQLEATCHEPPDWSRVRTMVRRYGDPTVTDQALDAWVKADQPSAARAA